MLSVRKSFDQMGHWEVIDETNGVVTRVASCTTRESAEAALRLFNSEPDPMRTFAGFPIKMLNLEWLL